VYKEEKECYAESERRARVRRADRAAARAAEDAEWRMIKVGHIRRTVLATIRGRLDGEEAVQKDKRGLPVKPALDAEAGARSAPPKKKAKVTSRPLVELSEEGKALWEAAKIPGWIRRLPVGAEWEVPDTDGEDELEPYSLPRYDSDGQLIPYDYWPSIWRNKVAEEVNGTWINMTVSVSVCVAQRTYRLGCVVDDRRKL
jgi:hypothetical protein